MFDPEVDLILRAVPEFAGAYLELVAAHDGDPGAAAAFAELAEFAAALAVEMERFRPLLTRMLAGVEQVAARSEDAEEVVGWGFLDNLSPDDLRRLEPWIGPATKALLEELELPPPDTGDAPSPPATSEARTTAAPPLPRRAEGRP